MHFIDNRDLCLVKSAKLQSLSPSIVKPLFGSSNFPFSISLSPWIDSPIAAAHIPFFQWKQLVTFGFSPTGLTQQRWSLMWHWLYGPYETTLLELTETPFTRAKKSARHAKFLAPCLNHFGTALPIYMHDLK